MKPRLAVLPGRGERRIALVTGVAGQDGSYLADLLLSEGYEVHGTIRPSIRPDLSCVTHLDREPRFTVHEACLTEGVAMARLLNQVRPTEVYNLAAQSHVGRSFENPRMTHDVNARAAMDLMDAAFDRDPRVRFYQASTSEVFGGTSGGPLSEESPFQPRSPYAVAKLAAHHHCANWRRRGHYACAGILFNHESPRRGVGFVTRKVAVAAARMARGERFILALGNLSAVRDWGHARDYCAGMIAMLRQDRPGDYVLATGKAHSVRYLVEVAFRCVGMEVWWTGSGLQEKGMIGGTQSQVVRVDPSLFRPVEVEHLVGDWSRAARDLCWQPTTTFEQLVEEMVQAEVDS